MSPPLLPRALKIRVTPSSQGHIKQNPELCSLSTESRPERSQGALEMLPPPAWGAERGVVW